MGQISLQLISSSAFDDCSVTVIYSGVIIIDALLLALTVLCRCDRVFWDYSGLIKCGALHFFVVSSSALCNVWLSGLVRGKQVTVSPDQQDRELITCSLWTNCNSSCSNRLIPYFSAIYP